MRKIRRYVTVALFTGMVICAVGWPRQSSAASYIVKDGMSAAQIVVADNPPRMVTLAARELQTYIEKISGARLSITNSPGAGRAVRIYVGKSRYTDALDIIHEGLKHGAFRVVSGEEHLILLGHDADFSPPQPWLSGNVGRQLVIPDWDEATGETFGYPLSQLYKGQGHGYWDHDERGSLNAVYAFLRSLGVRWYMPGELGEIVPRKTTIALPSVDRTVHPDFILRWPSFMRFGVISKDNAMWQLRMGFNKAADVIGFNFAHGMNRVLSRDEMQQAHPEYYVLYSGKRDTEFRNTGRPCLSSRGLRQTHARYVRKEYEVFDMPMVSIMPQDGYANLCQCVLCDEKGTPERGWKGILSDYVWTYMQQVARDVYATHPSRKVSCAAYGAYEQPPLQIDTLSPNLSLWLCQARRDFYDAEKRGYYTGLRHAWLDKMPQGEKRFWLYEYYLHTKPTNLYGYMPVYYPRSIATDLRSLKGICGGEFVDMHHDDKSMAVDHLNLYVTARCWWDAERDVDALLAEYYMLFYGPAADAMKAFIEYSEANWMELRKEPEKIDRVFELLDAARDAAPADSVHGRRIAFIADYFTPLRQLQAQLARGREGAREARVYRFPRGAEFVFDGKPDEAFWSRMAGYGLLELQTGTRPTFPTVFQAFYAGNTITFAIRCEDMGAPNIATRKPGDGAIWYGDCSEILLETQSHSYYQLAFNPAGVLVDLDRAKGLNNLWSSQAEVKTHIGENGWSAEVRIPIAAANQDEIDPENGIAGRRPTKTYPWYFNVCRQRVRENGSEYSAFSPTGKPHFHDAAKFGMLFVE